MANQPSSPPMTPEALLNRWREMVAAANAEGPIPHDEIGHANRWEAVSMCADDLERVLASAQPAPRAAVFGTWPLDCQQRAFVEGAAWWLFREEKCSPFAAERDEMEAEAVRRYGQPAPPPQETGNCKCGHAHGVHQSFSGSGHNTSPMQVVIQCADCEECIALPRRER